MATSTTRSSKVDKSTLKNTSDKYTEREKTQGSLPDREGNLQSEELESHSGSAENRDALIGNQARSFQIESKPMFQELFDDGEERDENFM